MDGVEIHKILFFLKKKSQQYRNRLHLSKKKLLANLLHFRGVLLGQQKRNKKGSRNSSQRCLGREISEGWYGRWGHGHHNYGDVSLYTFMYVAHCLCISPDSPEVIFPTRFMLVLKTLKRVGILHTMHCARILRGWQCPEKARKLCCSVHICIYRTGGHLR